jgi:hypothetical protein
MPAPIEGDAPFQTALEESETSVGSLLATACSMACSGPGRASRKRVSSILETIRGQGPADFNGPEPSLASQTLDRFVDRL